MPFVMELPNYRFPSFKSVLLLMWEKARDFRKSFYDYFPCLDDHLVFTDI